VVRQHRTELVECLTTVETRSTAEVEVTWLSSALAPQERAVTWMDRRRGVGTVYSALPATLPVYSFLLFALAPALVGNRVVARPASASRHCVELLAALGARSGLAVQLVEGPWASFVDGARNEADAVVFCGSREHGQALDALLPEQVRLVTQGPGVCALVVAADADVVCAAEVAVATRLFNSSQDCLATERVYVAEEIAGPFVDALVTVAAHLKVGPNERADTRVGPLLLPEVAPRWMGSLEKYGDVLRPGVRHAVDLYDLAVVRTTAESPVVLEETYCPVLPLVVYRSDSQLREMLALGDFALGLTVFGSPPAFGTLDFAHVAIGRPLYAFENAWAPFGGHRFTTLVRTPTTRRSGPVLVPYVLSDPA